MDIALHFLNIGDVNRITRGGTRQELHYAYGACRASLALIDSRFLVGNRRDLQPIKTIFLAVFLEKTYSSLETFHFFI